MWHRSNKKAEYDDINAIVKDCKFNFVNFEKIPGRIYPNYSLASQLIGYMGDEGVGLAGIEFSQQGILSPEIEVPLCSVSSFNTFSLVVMQI